MSRLWRFVLPMVVMALLISLVGSAGPGLALAKSRGQSAVGQRIFLPLVVQPPPTVRILGHSSYRATADTLTVVGEVVNQLPDPVYLVVVVANFYDAANQPVATGVESLALLTYTPFGQRTPFRLRLNPAPSTIARYDLSLRWSSYNRSKYRQLQVRSQQVQATPSVSVSGEIRNDGSYAVRPGNIAVTFYDAAGRVVDAEADKTETRRLESDKRASYEILTGRSIPFASYRVQAEGYVVP